MTPSIAAAPAPSWPAQFFGDAVPRRASAAVWLAGLALFGLFAFRLVFTTAIQRALPGLDAFYWLPPLALLCFGLGWGLASRAVFVFLAALPALCALNGSQLVTVWLLPEFVFSCLLAGWIVRRALSRRIFRIPCGWPDLAVGCLFLTLTLSGVWAALVPSAVNGLSVAFAIPFWSDKSEFNFLEMTPALAGGCVIFLLLRIAAAEAAEEFPAAIRRTILVQFFVAAALAGLSAILSVVNKGAVNRDLIWLPFGAIQLSAGPACLFGGYFVGAFVSRRTGWRWADFVAPALALAGMALSTSKIAWLVAVALLGLVAFRFARWRGLAAYAVVVAVVVAAAAAWVPRSSRSQLAHEAHILLDAQDWAQQGTAIERFMLWDTALRMAAQYPLTGLGLGSYSSAQDRFARNGFYGTLNWKKYSYPPILRSADARRPGTCYNAYYAHNDLLEIATGAGIPAALLFAAVCAAGIAAGFRSGGSPGSLGLSGVLALAAFLPISFLDSRLLYFANAVLFWQFAVLCFPVASAGAAPAPRRAWLPLLVVPVLFAVTATLIFAEGWLPKDRTFGVWNWRRQTTEGNFLLAREAQFLVPPDENLDGLIFQIPAADPANMRLTVDVDGREVAEHQFTSKNRFRFDLTPFRKPGQWTTVHVLASRWLGRGFLGTPLGVTPFSVSMKKIRNHDRKPE